MHRRHRQGRDAFAVALALVVLGSVVFHLLSPWWWTPIASNWSYIDDTILITFWITGVVFAAVVLFMAYCVFRFRHREGSRAAYQPENKRLEWWLSIVTGVGVAAMLAPGLFVWDQFVTVPKDATEVEVVGQQWQWSFRLPGKDGRLGTSEYLNVTPDNPLGLDPKDPNGQDDVIDPGRRASPSARQAGQDPASLPRRPARLLRAGVPRQDGHDSRRVTYYWFTPTRVGTFEALCAELCGTGHSHMRGSVVVELESDHQTWLLLQKTFAQLRAPVRADAGN